MDKLTSIEEIRELVTDVRNRRLGFITNFYLDEYKHNVWIQKGDLFYDKIGDTLFFIKKSEAFCNLFYNSISVDALSNDTKEFMLKFPNLVVMVDIVGRDLQCKPLINTMLQIGFAEATSLVRMTRITQPMEYNEDSTIALATSDEVVEIYDMLHQFFNEKTEQIPYLEELQRYTKDGHVIVCHEDGRIVGFVVYEINATTLYLRYWFTHPDFRNKKVGSRLLRRFFEEGKNTKRQLFWVIRTNENAIKRYRHYGFNEENMFDYIFTNGCIDSIRKMGGGKYLIIKNLHSNLTTCKIA